TINTLEFAAWALGEINSNLKRALLAEFIVGKSLGCLARYHEEWNAFDLDYKGKRVEVKSSGYGTPPFLPTKYPPKPNFDIAKRVWAWSNRDNEFVGSGDPQRFSDAYVFAATLGTSSNDFAPFETVGWEFYVAPTKRLDADFPSQKTISANTLERTFGKLSFDQLKDAVDQAIGETNT
ncbi:MAG: hypothetical protein KI788_07920, partial [Mameliella sp.]|nr:hypothetical protein [Mameliella sp.]